MRQNQVPPAQGSDDKRADNNNTCYDHQVCQSRRRHGQQRRHDGDSTRLTTVIVRVVSRESRNIRGVVGKIRVDTIIDVVPKSGAGLNSDPREKNDGEGGGSMIVRPRHNFATAPFLQNQHHVSYFRCRRRCRRRLCRRDLLIVRRRGERRRIRRR
jgi:hypothetical protein